MNFFDYALIMVVGLSMVLSIWRGFVREIISIIGLVLAFFAASRLSNQAGSLFDTWISSQTITNIAGFILVFVLVMVTVGLVGAFIRKLVHMADLTATDRTLGIFFGAARGTLLIGLAFLVYTAYAKPDQPWLQQSVLTPYALELSNLIGQTIPDGYPFSTRSGNIILPSPQAFTQDDAVEAIKKHITPEDKEAMKSLLLETLKEPSHE